MKGQTKLIKLDNIMIITVQPKWVQLSFVIEQQMSYQNSWNQFFIEFCTTETDIKGICQISVIKGNFDKANISMDVANYNYYCSSETTSVMILF